MPELPSADFPPPQDEINITPLTVTKARITDKTRRAFLKLPAKTTPAKPKGKIQLAYRKPPVVLDERLATDSEFVILSVDVAVPLLGVIDAGENEQTKFAGK